MTRYFHEKGLAAEVLAYESSEYDWLLTRRIPGEDCIHAMYLADPKRLCDTTAELLRRLHEESTAGCPVNRTGEYLENARRNFEAKAYDESLFPDNWGYASAEEAWRVIEESGKYLRSDVLLHGDYCLPNIMLDNWNFSGFIDLDAAGLGDRHIDLFWGMWSLGFNLKTDAYRERFLDAYGREKVNEEMFRLIAACEVFG
jgi:kanamycin kinase